ncbi:MAG TPA: DUF2934 domain-containing protein [Candidatus Dormibacteraeota bacterium]|nr:DUF2934 domain-containing protein [Candidatus Dormibacteraeota bacterium]
MSATAPAPKKRSSANAPQIVPQEERDAFLNALQRRTALRAFEVFTMAGSAPGDELSHWFQAEKELLERITDVRESGHWIHVNKSVQNIPATAITILVERNRAIVAQAVTPSGSQSSDSGSITNYFLAEWPGEVEPATASAYKKNGILTLMIEKSIPVSAPTKKSEKANKSA